MGPLRWCSILAAASAVLAITPEQMIAAPRRDEAVPNPSGNVALFSASQYSFDIQEKSSWWSLIDLKTGEINQLTNDSNVSEIVWLGDSRVLYINSTNEEIPGGAELWVSDISDFTNGYKAGSLPASLSGLKAITTKSGDVRFVVYGQSYANGTAYNEKMATKPRSSARIYDSLYVRHWDTWITTKFNSVFSGSLKAHGNGASQYTLEGSIKNLVSNIKNAECPYPPYGDKTDYDLSPDGKWVAFKSKAPDVPRANFTTSYIYIAPHDGSQKAIAINGRDSPAKPDGIDGDSSYPAFSPDSKKLAYFQMKGNSYEADRRILYVHQIGSNKTVQAIANNWDRSPEAVEWTADGKELVVNSEDYARSRLFAIPADAKDDFKPKNFTDGGTVSAYYQLPDSTWLVTDNTMWSSWNVYIASPSKGVIKTLASASQIDPELKGLGASDIDEFYYKGNWTDIQSWLVYPPDFDKSKTYPLLFYIHGGPQAATPDSWSTRWNPKVLADQGYVVVAPNPTGSTGFGQKLTDAIQNNWGDSPYDDLVKCWEYVRDNLSFVDTDNGVAAGASYGGFMINWIQGNPLGREFKALVSHDGPFFGDSRYNTDELWFVQHDNNGTIWDNRENYKRYDTSAAERILQFATPMLVIQSDNDFRLPLSEGIGLFNVLQERGVPSRFLNFPDESHWVVEPENSLVWHQQVLGWLNRYSGVRGVSLEDTEVEVVNYNP